VQADSSLKPNTSGLLAHAQRKSQQTRQRVHQAIDQFLREQQTVNFNTVAKAASVTKSYLYAHQDVRERIEALRTQQGRERLERQWTERQQHQARTDKTKDVLLEARDRRIKALEAENRQLKEELKVARGKLYEQV
jgi:predicted nuclease with TOPRIM domain